MKENLCSRFCSTVKLFIKEDWTLDCVQCGPWSMTLSICPLFTRVSWNSVCEAQCQQNSSLGWGSNLPVRILFINIFITKCHISYYQCCGSKSNLDPNSATNFLWIQISFPNTDPFQIHMIKTSKKIDWLSSHTIFSVKFFVQWIICFLNFFQQF